MHSCPTPIAYLSIIWVVLWPVILLTSSGVEFASVSGQFYIIQLENA